MTRRRSRLWWYRRFRKVYKKHGVDHGRAKTWDAAMFARRCMSPADQRALPPIKKRAA